jgi:hypothetical protein
MYEICGRAVLGLYVQLADSNLDRNPAESSARDLLRLQPLVIELANGCMNTESSDQVHRKRRCVTYKELLLLQNHMTRFPSTKPMLVFPVHSSLHHRINQRFRESLKIFFDS